MNLKDMFRLGLSTSALLVALALVACQGSSDSPAASTQGPQAAEIQTSATNLFAWSTKATISSTRQIEVGDHPSIKLEGFRVGGRDQRVRFFMTDDTSTRDLMSGAPQDRLFRSDGAISKTENEKWSLYSMVIEPASNLELGKFSENSFFNGVAITPQLMLCAVGALDRLKSASEARSRAYQNWQIDVLNIFVKPVQHAAQAESRMAIDPRLKALNFQVSLWTRSGDCFLPTEEDIGQAIDIADQRVED